jgi:HPt (histidine-containing phosphotransfer) domain-containing protein
MVGIHQADEGICMEILDQKIIKNLAAVLNDENVIQDLLQTFIEEGSRQIDEMGSALETANFELISRLAHTLKGSSGNLGALQLSDLCFQLEKAAEKTETEIVGSLINQIRISFGATKSALEAVDL